MVNQQPQLRLPKARLMGMTFRESVLKLEAQYKRGIITLDELKQQIAVEMILIDDDERGMGG